MNAQNNLVAHSRFPEPQSRLGGWVMGRCNLQALMFSVSLKM